MTDPELTQNATKDAESSPKASKLPEEPYENAGGHEISGIFLRNNFQRIIQNSHCAESHYFYTLGLI